MLADASSSGDAVPQRHRLSSPERKAAIVKKAFELFSQSGFRGTTTRELAAAVGVSEPVLYQHFETKRDLYTAIIDEMISSVTTDEMHRLEEIGLAGESRAYFTALAHHILRWYLDDTSRIRLLIFSALEGHELADLWQQRVTKQIVGFIEQFIERRIADGDFVPVDPPTAARFFLGAMGHYGMMTAIFRCPYWEKDQQAVIDDYVTFFLRSMGARA